MDGKRIKKRLLYYLNCDENWYKKKIVLFEAEIKQLGKKLSKFRFGCF